MIINTIEELRLSAPAHALDSIDGIVGFIDNSEHDFLEEKLGTPLYEKLCQWYDENPVQRSTVDDYKTDYFNRLLLLAQRCVAFDALGRAAGMQVVSVNNAGINQLTADDYKTADKDSVDTYRKTCQNEAHAALNQLLRQLEQWCREVGTTSVPEGSVTDDSASGNIDEEKKAITTLWKQSAYYYLAASLLIPSCQVMQQYLNIYDSREKFIQMLPDLQFIQEEQIAPAIGEPLMLAVIAYARDGILPVPDASVQSESDAKVHVATMDRLVHRLRKVVVSLLVGRTSVIKYNKEQKIQAHDDGVRMLQNVVEFLRQHQQDFPEALVKDAGWYVAPVAPAQPEDKDVSPCGCQPSADSHHPSERAACWTPPLL